MNTAYLAYALEIERVGSITQAAQNLFMAQPNLSKALKELEKELGYPIFKRTALGVKATQEGEEFLFHAKHIMDHWEARGGISQRSKGVKGRYKLSNPGGSNIAIEFTPFTS